MTDKLTTCPACLLNSAKLLRKIRSSEMYKLLNIKDKQLVQDLDSNAPTFYSIIQCLNCQLDYCIPNLAPNLTWYEKLYSHLDLYPSARWEYSWLLNNNSTQATICDLGCGSGYFVETALKKGFDSYGIDFNAQSSDNNYLVKSGRLILTDLQNIDESKLRYANIITAFHFIEHLEDPCLVFNIATKIGNSCTKLYISVPSDRRPSRIFDEFDFLDSPPHHLTRWTTKSFSAIAKLYGWELVCVRYEPIKFSEKVWNITIRNKTYQRIEKKIKSRYALKALRTILFLPSAIFHNSLLKQMSGFSMLAEFKQSNPKIISS